MVGKARTNSSNRDRTAPAPITIFLNICTNS
jgi:hypothetical protein